MDRLNPDCTVWSPQTPLCVLPHTETEEREEEAEGHPVASFCYTLDCADVISHTDDPHWSLSEPPAHLWTSCRSDPVGRGPGALSSQRSNPVNDADDGELSQHFINGCCLELPGRASQGCGCVNGQREPEGLGPGWPGCRSVYYGVRRNLVVEVEVVEEVAVEDTLVITEEMYTDYLMDAEFLQDAQLYPT